MKNRPAMELQTLFQIRHAFLTLVSGTLLILIVEQIFPKWYYHDFLYAICSSRAWTQPLELLYYLNYLVKCWELIDVVLFVLKKKKPGKSRTHYYAWQN
jgi:fatty acid elongase 3